MSVSRVFRPKHAVHHSRDHRHGRLRSEEESLTKFYKDDEYHFNVCEPSLGCRPSPCASSGGSSRRLREALPDHSLSTVRGHLRIYTQDVRPSAATASELRLHGGSVETTVGQMNFFRWFARAVCGAHADAQVHQRGARVSHHAGSRVSSAPVETMSVHLQPAFLSFD
jgi:hypothetical protein